MTRARLLKEINSIEDAKKVEETVKTGYTETAIENLEYWAAAEEDLAESYEQMAKDSKNQARRDAYIRLQEDSKRNTVEISGLVDYLKGLDDARAKRIELLKGLHP